MHSHHENSLLDFNPTDDLPVQQTDDTTIPVSSSFEGPVASVSEEKQTASCFPLKAGLKLKLLFYTVPLINAAIEALQTDFGVQDKSKIMRSILTSTTFLTAMGIGAKFTVHGMKEIYEYIRTGKTPKDWKELTGKKKYVALGSAIAITSYVAFSDAAQSYYFVEQMPGKYQFDSYVTPASWKVPCWTIAGTTAIGFMFSEGLETYKAVSEILSSEQYDYSSELSRYVSQISMGGLGYFGAVNDVLISYMGVKEVFRIETSPGICVIGTLSVLNGVTDYSMNARFIRDTMDDFIAYVREDKVTKKDILAFLISTSASGILAYAGQEFVETFWMMALKELMVDQNYLVGPLVAILSWGGAAHYFATSVPSIYPLTHKMADYLEKGCTAIYQRIATCQEKKTSSVGEPHDKPLLDDVESQAIRESLQGQHHTIFSKNNKTNDEERLSRKRCSTLCNIL